MPFMVQTHLVVPWKCLQQLEYVIQGCYNTCLDSHSERTCDLIYSYLGSPCINQALQEQKRDRPFLSLSGGWFRIERKSIKGICSVIYYYKLTNLLVSLSSNFFFTVYNMLQHMRNFSQNNKYFYIFFTVWKKNNISPQPSIGMG